MSWMPVQPDQRVSTDPDEDEKRRSIAGIRLPPLAEAAAAEVGQASGGVALFTLGLILYGIKPKVDLDVVINVLIKNVGQPMLLLAAGIALGLSGDVLKEVFLLGVLPSATAVPALALRHDLYSDEAATSVMMSTLFGLLSISAGIAIATHL